MKILIKTKSGKVKLYDPKDGNVQFLFEEGEANKLIEMFGIDNTPPAPPKPRLVREGAEPQKPKEVKSDNVKYWFLLDKYMTPGIKSGATYCKSYESFDGIISEINDQELIQKLKSIFNSESSDTFSHQFEHDNYYYEFLKKKIN